MKKTGLYGVGLLVAAVSLMASCSGGDSGSDNTGGKGSTAGSSTGGSSASGSSSGGSTNNAGTNSTAGNNNTGGSNNNQGGDGPGPGPDPDGGDGPGPGPGGGGDGPGPGGELPACGAGQEDGEDCEQGDDPCEPASGGVCFCGGGQNPEWNCINFGGEGGGPGGGFGNADCGDNPMSDDECDGFGQCEGSETCACFQGNVICQQ